MQKTDRCLNFLGNFFVTLQVTTYNGFKILSRLN